MTRKRLITGSLLAASCVLAAAYFVYLKERRTPQTYSISISFPVHRPPRGSHVDIWLAHRLPNGESELTIVAERILLLDMVEETPDGFRLGVKLNVNSAEADKLDQALKKGMLTAEFRRPDPPISVWQKLTGWMHQRPPVVNVPAVAPIAAPDDGAKSDKTSRPNNRDF